jgi:hypothetical protein
MTDWTDPLDWLLGDESPAVRHLALRDLLGRPAHDPDVIEARSAAMTSAPIAPILAAQHADGYWVKPGAGYGPKYSGTVWNVSFLDQMGADGADARVRAACEYVLMHTQAPNGGFGASQSPGQPPPSSTIHCLTGNLLRALIGFGWLADPRVMAAVDWESATITGEGVTRWYATTPGPDFRCGYNLAQPCAWGAAKAVLALARVPADRRSPETARALRIGVDFLLSRDPARADYPTAEPGAKPNGSWFRLGFPVGYVADVLQVLEALCDAGWAGDTRLRPAVEWLLAQRDADGRWANRYTYHAKMVRDIDSAGKPSKWVTYRASRVLKAVAEA